MLKLDNSMHFPRNIILRILWYLNYQQNKMLIYFVCIDCPSIYKCDSLYIIFAFLYNPIQERQWLLT